MAVPISRAEALAVLLDLLRLAPEPRRLLFRSMPVPARRAILDEWWWQAHGGQEEPACGPDGEPWRVWAIVAGRGFGKTRAGAEWVWARAREAGTVTSDCPLRIALVAASLDEVARVMVEGESGLLALARCDERPRWIASRGLLLFPSGAEAHAFSAERPEKLRGPQHHYAWCDELAKWPHSDATWNNLMLGLRLGTRPRTIVTTTPKPVPLLKRILALDRSVTTHGRTAENLHLPADFIEAMDALFAGTRLARQELEGLLLDEFEGALWTRELLEKARNKPSPLMGEGLGGGGASGNAPPFINVHPTPALPIKGREDFHRVVIGLDPPASTGGDSCGIVVCGQDAEGIAWVLADLTAHGLSPEAWARRVAEAAAQYGVSRVVAEKNQGGDMIASVLRAVDADLPVRLVAATRSKAARAEPIALRFETGRARLAGSFPELEDQLCALTWAGYQGAGSPDRADAMVWAM
ncbi:MAG TPA: terminase family protein, partial [Allosphingosinicella sp.]|nr:terminase family protein [Allosphingosinicella sp.]